MEKIAIRSDKYFNNKAKYDDMFGDAVYPVDLNAAFVPVKSDKWGSTDKKIAEDTQDNIRERFALETPEESY